MAERTAEENRTNTTQSNSNAAMPDKDTEVLRTKDDQDIETGRNTGRSK